MIRKKVRAKRGAASANPKPPLDGRIAASFETWGKLLDPANEQDLLRRLDRFEHLRTLFLEDQAATTFIELGFASLLLQNVKQNPPAEILANHLFTISDLVDVDDSGVLGEYYYREGLLDIALALWRSVPPLQGPASTAHHSQTATKAAESSPSSSNDTFVAEGAHQRQTLAQGPSATVTSFLNQEISRLKAASLCVLSGLVLFDFKNQQNQTHSSEARVSHLLESDLEAMNLVLQCKGYTSLHARCINFANNLYVFGQCKEFISVQLLPSILALLMFNVSNHIKLRKKRLMQHPAVTEPSAAQQPTAGVVGLGPRGALPEGDYETAIAHGQQKKQKAQETAASSSNEPHEIMAMPASSPPAPQPSSSSSSSAPPSLVSPSPSSTSLPVTTQQSQQQPDGSGAAALSATPTSQHATSAPSLDTDNVDPFYDDTTYHEFLSSACLFLSNVTARVENCRLADLFSVTEIMTLLFHHSTDHSLDALISVIKCLANLANLAENRSKLIESNILPMAAKLVHLNMEHAEELKANLVLLLANLSGFESSNKLLIEAGVVFPIADLIARSQSTPYRAYGCLALANLCLDSTAVPQVMKSQASLKKLLELCYNSNPFVRRQVARVIYAIASYPAGTYIPDLRQLGADASLRYIITMSNKQSETIVPPQSAEFLATTALSIMQAFPTSGASSIPASVVAATPSPSPALATSATSTSAPSKSPSVLPHQHHHQQPPPTSTSTATSTATPATPAITGQATAPPSRQPTTPAPGVAKAPSAAPATTPTTTTATAGTGAGTGTGTGTPTSTRSKVGRAPNPARSQEEKERGNEFFRKKKYKESIICYTRAAEFNPDDATLFSNRSAAYLHLEHYELALRDAERCIDMTPTWVKGYFRKGKALLGQEKFEEALDAFKAAADIDPGNKEIQDALRITQLRMKNKHNPLLNHPLTTRLNAFVAF